MGTCASKQDTVVESITAPPKRDGGPVPAKAPSASEGQVLARQGTLSALGQASQLASRATDTRNRRGSLIFAAVTGTSDTEHSNGDASSDKQKHNTHLVVLKDSDGHLILGRQANDRPKHGIAHSAAAMIGQALRSTVPRNNSFDTLRKEGSFTSLQSEHHVDVRSLPELPPALFLAAVLNDVAFFKGIPVIQLATELSALKAWKAAQASRAEVPPGIKSIKDQQAPASTAQAGSLIGPTASTASSTASSIAAGPQSTQLAVGATAPGHASSTPPPPISVPPLPPLPSVAGSVAPTTGGGASGAGAGTHASTVPRRGSPLAAASVTATGGATPLGQSLSAPPALPAPLPPSGVSMQGSRASVLSAFLCSPVSAAQHAVQASTGGGAAAAYSGPSISDLCHAVDKHGDTLLMLAAAAGSADVLELILSLRPVSIKQVKPGTGNTLLHFACDGPAHVAAIYKAIRAHVLHNAELLSDLIAHHTDPSPAVLAAAAASAGGAVAGGSAGSEGSGPGIDIDGSTGLSPGPALEALPSSRPTSGRATPVTAAASGPPGAALVHQSATAAHAHAIAVQEQLILQSYVHSPEENLAGLHRDLHSLSGVNLHAAAAAAAAAGGTGAGGAAQHSSTAGAVTGGGGSAGPAPRGSPPGHGHTGLGHHAHNSSGTGLSALLHAGAGGGGSRRDSNDSFRNGGAGPHHHDRGSSGVLTSLALNTAQSLAVHGPAPGTELPSVIPGLNSYPHAHAGGGGAHAAAAAGGGGLLSPGGGLMSPMPTSRMDGHHGLADHGGARNSMPSVAAGAVLAAAAGHPGGGHGRSSSLSQSVSLGPALAGGTGAGGAPPLHPALGRQPSAFQLPSATASAAAAEGAAAAVPTGSHAHPLLTPHHHPPVHAGGPAGALSAPYITTPALLHMQHGHGGHHFERHHPHAAHHHHPGTPGGSHGHGHGHGAGHGHGHHTPDDPLFIAGFSYLKALMGYTERFEDGVGDTAGGGSEGGAGPVSSPSGSESPRSSHRSAGGAGGGKAASKEVKGARGGRAQSPPGGADGGHGPVPVSPAALAASTARRRNSLLGSLMGQGGASTAAAGGGGAASGSLRVSIPAVSSVGSNLSGVGVGHGASAGPAGAGGAGAAALPLEQSARPLPAPGGISAPVPASALPGLGLGSRVASVGSLTPASSAAAVAAATATAAAQGKDLPPVGDDHGCGHGEGGVIPYLSPVYRITSDINTIPVYARFPARSIQRSIDILLAHGANPRCKNSYGRTPLDIARAHLSQVQLQGPGATAGGVLSGMEDGVILHDPPWSILLSTVGGHADWTCAMDSMNSACAAGPMAKCPANVPAIVPSTAAAPAAAGGGASQGGGGGGSAAASTAPVIMATSHLAHVVTAPVPRGPLTVGAAAGAQPVPVSKGAGTGTQSANTTGAPSSGENSPAGSEGSAFTQGSAPSACTAGGGPAGQGGRAVQQIGLSLLPGDSPQPPGGSTDSVQSSGSGSITGGGAPAEVSSGLGLGLTSTVGTVGRGQVGLVPFSLVQGQVQHVLLQPNSGSSTGTAMPMTSATAAVPAAQGQQPPALTDGSAGGTSASDTASGSSGAASQE